MVRWNLAKATTTFNKNGRTEPSTVDRLTYFVSRFVKHWPENTTFLENRTQGDTHAHPAFMYIYGILVPKVFAHTLRSSVFDIFRFRITLRVSSELE